MFRHKACSRINHMSLPDDVRVLKDLFAEALADVRFPDVDASALASGVARVDALAADADRLEAELAAARAEHQAALEELLRAAARAHGYARVYAEGDEALRARLDALELGRSRPKPSPDLTKPT